MDGTASIDVDGVVSRFQWLATNDVVKPDSGLVAATNTSTATLTLPLGVNHIVLNVYDDKLATSQATTTITVVDSTPPGLASPGHVVVYVGESSSTSVDIGFPGVADVCDPHPTVNAVWLLDGEIAVNLPLPDPKHAVLPLGSHLIR